MDAAALAIGSVTGAQPDIAWAKAPWFNEERFLGWVSAEALAEAAMRTMDYGHDLDTEAMRARFRPWFRAIDVVSFRRPAPEALAKMAIRSGHVGSPIPRWPSATGRIPFSASC